jgi:hypothetical protein
MSAGHSDLKVSIMVLTLLRKRNATLEHNNEREETKT